MGYPGRFPVRTGISLKDPFRTAGGQQGGKHHDPSLD